MTILEQILEGIAIICKYDSNAEVSAEHDTIYFGNYELVYREAKQEDFERLVALDWHTEYGSWCHYV